jgi:hypothetical protein
MWLLFIWLDYYLSEVAVSYDVILAFVTWLYDCCFCDLIIVSEAWLLFLWHVVVSVACLLFQRCDDVTLVVSMTLHCPCDMIIVSVMWLLFLLFSLTLLFFLWSDVVSLTWLFVPVTGQFFLRVSCLFLWRGYCYCDVGSTTVTLLSFLWRDFCFSLLVGHC